MQLFDNRIDAVTVGLDLENRLVQQGNLLKLNMFGNSDIQVGQDGDTTWIAVEHIKAVRADGSVVPLRGQRIPVIVQDAVSASKVPDETGVRIFPNPSSGQVFIRSDEITPLRYRVFAGHGQLMASGSVELQTRIHLPPGIYVVEVIGQKVHAMQKICVFE